jgi:hypothetical protein
MVDSAFSQGTVAFLDILGFKMLVTSAEHDTARQIDLRALVKMLDDHVVFEKGNSHPQVSENLKPGWIFISDSLIISSLNECTDDRDLAAVTLKTVQIANTLLNMGFLIRGGISRGLVWRKAGNIFGSAYMQAYAQEQSTEWPRVQLTKAAEEAWRASPLCDFLPLTIDLGVSVVDLFNPHYTASEASYEDYFEQLHDTVKTRAAHLAAWSSPRLKWDWVRDFVHRTQNRFPKS